MDLIDSIHPKDLQVTNTVKISYIDSRIHHFSYSHLVTIHINDPKVPISTVVRDNHHVSYYTVHNHVYYIKCSYMEQEILI